MSRTDPRTSPALLLPLLLALALAPASAPAETVVDYGALCGDGATAESFCMPVPLIRRLLAQPVHIVGAEETAEGIARTYKLTLRATDPDTGSTWEFPAKWRAIPPRGGKLNNRPSRELAVLAIQDALWPPERHVVPPSAVHCIDREVLDAHVEGRHRGLRGAACVPGLLTWWVENVTQGDYWDEERWESDPAYRSAFADFDLFTHLINHRDSRDANFLRSTDPAAPRFLSIDHGLSFAGFRNTRVMVHLARYPSEGDFAHIVAPEVIDDVVQRLRQWSPETIDALATVLELHIAPDGAVTVVEPGERIPGHGRVRRRGQRVQFGLGARERHRLQDRIEELLEDVDEGKLKTFDPGSGQRVAGPRGP